MPDVVIRAPGWILLAWDAVELANRRRLRPEPDWDESGADFLFLSEAFTNVMQSHFHQKFDRTTASGYYDASFSSNKLCGLSEVTFGVFQTTLLVISRVKGSNPPQARIPPQSFASRPRVIVPAHDYTTMILSRSCPNGHFAAISGCSFLSPGTVRAQYWEWRLP